MRISDECYFRFDRAYRALGHMVDNLPVYGVGHSLGSLAHLLISARYPLAPRAGNVLMSYNNRPAYESIPLLAPLIAPSATILGPLLKQIAQSPVRAPVEVLANQLRTLSPGVVRQVLPLIEQMQASLHLALPWPRPPGRGCQAIKAPLSNHPVAKPPQMMYMDVAAGRREFIPAPEETRRLVRSYYAVPRNLLIRFRSDSIDETSELSSMLANNSAVESYLDMTIKVMSGGHGRPLAQTVVEVPREVASLGSQGAEFVGRLAQMAGDAGMPYQLTSEVTKLSQNVAEALNDSARGSSASRSPWAGNLEELASHMADFMVRRVRLPWETPGRRREPDSCPRLTLQGISDTRTYYPPAGPIRVGPQQPVFVPPTGPASTAISRNF